ncbi:NAD(P)-binding domain protein [Metarhizium album ARSEF 1941]|uniref:NAD(P)-binding domain protein n=1 Tax=Metarhizium album (strain ARSEF 1941) TaxID=1081103 RepID=A0A0B2WLV1_METAS|nr:NAD(P)-binding domain protein [Metarhizium album ARSEF 1941]KHN93995.1 NAD(P)-binding domain protein [Metarhizium album ARSEF 1941]
MADSPSQMAARGTIVLTGANGGLGSAIVRQISSKPELLGHHGLYIVRDASAAPALASALERGSSSHTHEAVSLDLNDLDRVRRVAQDINSRVSSGQIPPILVLVLNAGFLDFCNQAWTGDGYDVTFASNYLGHWLLTLLLLQSMDKETGSIVVVSSQSHDPSDPRNARGKAFKEARYKQIIGSGESSVDAIAKGTWSSAKEDPSFRSGFRRYGASKLCLVMMLYELRRRSDKDSSLNKLRFVGVDPGSMVTSIQRHAPWVIRVAIFGILYPVIACLFPNGPVRTPERSASDVLDAALAPNRAGGEGSSEALYLNGRDAAEANSEVKDPRKRELLWKQTVKYTRLVAGETILCHWQ